MSRMTSAVRLEEPSILHMIPTRPEARPASGLRIVDSLRTAVGDFSDLDLEALEDELDFYAFTGVAGPRVKHLLAVL